MHQSSTTSVFRLFKINFHLAIRNNLLLSIGYLFLIPLLRGVENLDSIRSAECLEQSVILIGALLLVPLHAPEQSRAIQEVVYTKKTSYNVVLLMRIVMAYLSLFILSGIFAFSMLIKNCTFPYAQYIVGTVISASALGSIGLFSAVISNSAVIGYLISIGYYLTNLLRNIPEHSIFFLFSMSAGNPSAKLWLFFFSTLLLLLTFLFFNVRNISRHLWGNPS